MGFWSKTGAWLRGVFGGSESATVQSVMPPSMAIAARGGRIETPLPTTDPVRQSWDRLKSFVARCEAEDLDLAGLHIEDPIGFWARYTRIECAKLRGTSPESAVRAEGLSCLDHWVVVDRYFQARYSELVRQSSGKLAIRFIDAFQRAADQSERAVNEARDAIAREAAELEPIGGVTLERFAEIGAALAHLGAEATRARTTEVLAAFGVGAATFGSVRRGWEARMEADKTKRLRRSYRKAWTHATAMLESGDWQLPTADASATSDARVRARYTWVESVENRPEYRSSLMTG